MSSGGELLAARLRSALGAEAEVIVEAGALEPYSADTYWKALAARAGGEPLGLPDVVVRPATEDDVVRVLEIASELGVAVVPRGGGSGSQGGAIPLRGGVVLDLTRLDRILEVDHRSLTVTAQAGVNGLTLERALAEEGLTLPHYPASADLATVGGYVAARGSGVLSTRYGKIEDLLLSLRVVTAEGRTFDTVSVPRHAVGPELTQLYVGSEGILGVITRATLQVIPIPEKRRFELVSFASLADGVEAIRSAISVGLRPSVARLYDAEATRTSLAKVVDAELPGVCAVLCCEGVAAVADAEAESLLGYARANGAQVLDAELAETWWKRRYDFYKPPHHPQLPSMWGTLEAVATYARILDVYEALQAAVAVPYAEQGLRLKAHMSHWYPWGTMIYGRFVVPEPGRDPLALHDRIWEDGITAILDAGAVMNDHHGVGIKLAPFMQRQHGASLETLRQIKRALDPNGIMNPGKMSLS
ncbi:MAG: FAD-binding oxidoreductase [bacterium]